ncbi:uncharacterized protein C8A04DRAFT_31844, partial [Dichotomopilus funicola]
MATETPTTSHLTPTSISPTPLPSTPFTPHDGNLFPKWPTHLSPTAVETWLFDGMASDGSAAFTASFFRDGSQAPNPYRVAINALWADGTAWSQHLVTPESVVEVHEGGRVTGVWRTTGESTPGITASFDVAGDLSTATVTFNAPGRITGTLTQRSRGYTTLPATAREAEVAPGAYWMRPIAVADIDADLTLFINDPAYPPPPPTKPGQPPSHPPVPTIPKQFLLTSSSSPSTTDVTTDTDANNKEEKGTFGGLDRSWLPLVWTHESTDALFIRARAGPYDIALMRLVAKAHKYYQPTVSAALYRDGRLISRALHALPSDRRDDATTADAVRTERVYEGGGLRGGFRNGNGGVVVDFRGSG